MPVAASDASQQLAQATSLDFVSSVFDVISDETRRRLLEALRDAGREGAEPGVTDLSQQLGISRSTVARQLRTLVVEGFASYREDGPRRRYQLVPDRLHEVAEWAAGFDTSPGPAADDAREGSAAVDPSSPPTGPADEPIRSAPGLRPAGDPPVADVHVDHVGVKDSTPAADRLGVPAQLPLTTDMGRRVGRLAGAVVGPGMRVLHRAGVELGELFDRVRKGR